MDQKLALALAALTASAAWASDDATLQAAILAQVDAPEINASVTVAGCAVAVTTRREEVWEGVPNSETIVYRMYLGDFLTEPAQVELADRPTRDEFGNLAFALSYRLTREAREDFSEGMKRMMAQEDRFPSFWQIMWSIIWGDQDLIARHGEKELARAQNGAFGQTISRNYTTSAFEEADYRDFSFTPGFGGFFMLHGSAEARAALVEAIHTHRQAHCP